MITCLHAAYPVYWTLLLARSETKKFCSVTLEGTFLAAGLRIACAGVHGAGWTPGDKGKESEVK